jgi:hypothetical protein
MQSNANHRRDLLLVIFSSLGILGLLIRCVSLVITGILSFKSQGMTDLSISMLGALGMLFCAALLLPMLIFTIKHLKGRELPPAIIKPIKLKQLAILVLVWLVIVIIGAVVANLFAYGWAVASPFFLLGISLPILSLIWIGTGGLPTGSTRRLWSVYGISLVGSTLAAMLMEYLLVGMAVVVVGIAAGSNPEFLSILNQIKNQLTSSDAGDIQTLLAILTPYLTNPVVIFSILAFAAGLGPLIEEAIKPAAIWLLGKRLRSTSEGFMLGILCGAGFATMEGILAASGTTQMLGFGLAARAPASLMHITASGILGWGIASAQLEKRYGRLVLAYLVSVSIHGLWNGSAIIAVYGSLQSIVQNARLDLLSGLLVLIGLGTLLLTLVSLLIALPLINHHLRQLVAPTHPRNLEGSGLSTPAPIKSDFRQGSNPKQSDIIAPPDP